MFLTGKRSVTDSGIPLRFAHITSLLEQLANAGIKGSLAGTGLTNIISRLGNENSKFAKTLGRTVDGFDEFIEGLLELKTKRY